MTRLPPVPLLLCAVALGPRPAQAAEIRQLWSRTGAELLPDHDADTQFRLEEQVGAELGLADAWDLDLLGGVRTSAVADLDPTGDLYRLTLHRSFSGHTLSAGRLVRHGVQGIERLDGVLADLSPDAAVSARTWAGRQWHPETWQPGDTWALGTELSWRPERHGPFVLHGGAEGHLVAGAPAVRLFSGAGLRGVRGEQLTGVVELQPADPGDGEPAARARVGGSVPLLRTVELGAGWRWEDLDPVSSPVALDSPLTWLSPEGYHVAEVQASHGRGDLYLDYRGGFAFRPSGDAGYLQRAAATWQGAPVGATLAVFGAAVGDASVEGGVARVSLPVGSGALFAESGLFHLVPGASGPAAWVQEHRLGGAGDLGQGLHLRGELATGQDRILQNYLRAGLALTAQLGGAS